MRECTGDRRTLSRRAITAATTVAATSAVFFGAAVPAWAADAVTLTFVRHAESFGNIPGATLNTQVPGPNLTPLGVQQALDIAPDLALAGFDGIYYSDMIRTLETATPLIGFEPDLQRAMYGGFREISAGIFEGAPVDEGLGRIGYFLIPLTWGLGLRSIPIPLGEGGNEFQDRYSDAVSSVLATGAVNPVIFSHGAAIMVWTAMNVDNPDIGMLLANPLGNTQEVVLTGNEEDGWMMQSYAGMPVSQDPSLFTQLFVNARDLIVAPQTAVYNVVQALGTVQPAEHRGGGDRRCDQRDPGRRGLRGQQRHRHRQRDHRRAARRGPDHGAGHGGVGQARGCRRGPGGDGARHGVHHRRGPGSCSLRRCSADLRTFQGPHRRLR